MDNPIKSGRAIRTTTAIFDKAYKRRRAHDNNDDVVELSQPIYKASRTSEGARTMHWRRKRR